ncbi:F-box protein Pof7 [Schizosaccharomyces japonicus yFS275]|uniref:F-box protein Pof7 n=1 Tax=Schizosaccharomyces japonicus (strain yFS275 / FY16936) TaxID=402676 RepID=B6K4T8_SCHJY|nr:F-box protein Pof7 [Schizosaccharomyces japonicus yFS275]EEB08495.1 F-box protein Pof7 [Schizosaccharomyces japonicus yFS275]
MEGQISPELQNALELYSSAIKLEQQGELSDSLEKYRQAHKSHEDVEEVYRKLERLKLAEGRRTAFTEDDKTKSVDSSEVNAPDELVTHRIISAIEKLPQEVLLIVLQHCFRSMSDVKQLCTLSLVSRRFASALRSDILYQQFCYYSVEDHEWFEPLHAIEQEVKESYNNSWKYMFRKKPRIRYDGCYIDRCRYFREGTSDTGWNQVVHLITYYRYLRFYPDGSCIVYQSPSEPKDIVRLVNRFVPTLFTPSGFSSAEVAAKVGTWSMSPSGHLVVSYNSSIRYTNVQELQVRGRRLHWLAFYSLHTQTSEKIDFPLTQNRDYFFSKVRSYSLTE